MAFPTSPVNNQQATVNGITYTYNSTDSAWYRTGTILTANITSNTASTSTTTGALTVAGGVGVVGNVYAGNFFYANGAAVSGAGSVGYTGSAGAGYTGSAGSAGSAGSVGYTGSTGTGYTGSAGTDGATGATGVIGYTGSQGTSGATGPSGYSGSSGTSGSSYAVMDISPTAAVTLTKGTRSTPGANSFTTSADVETDTPIIVFDTGSGIRSCATDYRIYLYGISKGIFFVYQSSAQPPEENLLVEYSKDNNTWTNMHTVPYTGITDNTWVMREITIPAGAKYAGGVYMRVVQNSADGTGADIWAFTSIMADVTGATGPSGAIGASGATGASGEIGASGASGATGVSGASGPAGYSGSIGAGYTGSQGSIGATGATGATGVGYTGSAGTNGATGATGATGVGYTGSVGATGTPGAASAIGYTGSVAYIQGTATDLATEILSDSPYGYWKMNETSGSTAVDYGSGANNLTYSGTYSLAYNTVLPTSSEKFVLFNSTTANANKAGSILTVPVTNNWTVEGIVVPYLDDSNIVSLLAIAGTGETLATNFQLQLFLNAAGEASVFWEYSGGTNVSLQSGYIARSGVPLHIAAVKDSTAKTIDFYFNGIRGITQTYTTEPAGGTTVNTYIGADGTNTGAPSLRAHIAYYNTKLTEDRIQTRVKAAGLYNLGYVTAATVTGYVGSSGYTGSAGVNGSDGATGPVGYTGSAGGGGGGNGYTGSQGIQGNVGYTGSAGTGGGGGSSTPRIVTITDGTTVAINADTTDMAVQTNTQTAGTLTMAAPTGTLYDGQKIMFRLRSANVQTFAWNAVFDGSTDLNLPSASSGGNKYDYMGFIYNSTSGKWDIIAKNFGF